MAAVVATKQRKRKLSRRTSQREERNGVKKYQVADADIEKGAVKPHTFGNGGNNGGEPSRNTEYEQLKEEAEHNLEDSNKQKPDVEEGDVIGIITMEDVMEELLQVPFTSTFPKGFSFISIVHVNVSFDKNYRSVENSTQPEHRFSATLLKIYLKLLVNFDRTVYVYLMLINSNNKGVSSIVRCSVIVLIVASFSFIGSSGGDCG